MKKYLLALLFVIACFPAKAQQADEYPLEVKFYCLQKQYDIARWYMYCAHCKGELAFRRDIQSKLFLYNPFLPHEKITYGELSLKFDNLVVNGDTVDINCSFLYNGHECDASFLDMSPIEGIAFVDKKVWMFSNVGCMRYLFDYRIADPLQPEVKDYIINNQSKLNPWFLEEAKRRKVL